ncbi:Nuclear prelamin A recognition factor [Myotis brandtii]|uniref:Nuclear prelamin A recognition factor n=1 Tax=Myotis brandtii TaxID=109478 RepID=S7NDI3_MYOBR|nr:Nuclear prelamin A recognition factor [Myotis brandtii]
MNAAPMDTLFGDMKEEEVRLHEGASSDGYLVHIFRHTAKELFNEDVGVLTYCTLRNKDFQEDSPEAHTVPWPTASGRIHRISAW